MTLSPELNAAAIAYTPKASNGDGTTRNGSVLVTGGSRGIGRAICRAFAEDAFDVFFFYLQNHEAAHATCANLLELDVHADGLCVDVADQDAVAAAFARLDEAGVEVSVVVNCAGITLDRTVPKLTSELWQRVIDTNLTGCFNCSQAAVARMRERGYGRIVNISSVIAQTGNIGQANYAAAKAGMIGLTKTLALETAKYDITVNAVCPGFIETDMLRDVPEEVREQIVSQIPKRRFGMPDEVARLVKFLADPASGYVTGQQFNINGGLHM
jgi:NAD(P)-dependent dehydrogenase (short-subunit alcohol dehydrogenase family)